MNFIEQLAIFNQNQTKTNLILQEILKNQYESCRNVVKKDGPMESVLSVEDKRQIQERRFSSKTIPYENRKFSIFG